MANGNAEEDLGVSPFPHPPKLFYKHYTDDNVKEGKASQPPQPIQGAYFMFGSKFDTNDTMIRKLKEQDIKQLYPDSHDRKAELRKLNRSIVVCFLELLDILILNPASPARSQKITDLSFLFINMHHLINEFRPHQARETLKVIMERQKKQREDIVAQLLRDMEEVRSILKECGDLITQAAGTVPGSLHIALSGGGGGAGGGGAEGEKTEMTVKSESMEVPGKESSEMNGVKSHYVGETSNLVDKQDAELCAVIDSLMPIT